jgi:DNA invertase Pin-like site-specific DNA recombinase
MGPGERRRPPGPEQGCQERTVYRGFPPPYGTEEIASACCLVSMTAQAVQKAPTRVMTFPTTLVGYARVSTDAQSLEAQMAALEAAGCERVYAEKRSGAETDRKALAKLLKEASPGDTVVVTRLDRLARSTRDLLVRLGKDNIGFKSLRETSVDTTSPQGRFVVNILASISEFERELIHARMTEGRKRAVANGVKFGPKFKLNSFQRQEALARLAAGESQSVVAKTYGVDPATISRLQGKAARPD